MFFYNCKSTSAWNDCYNFHTGGFGASQCRLVFVNCIGVDGNQGKDNRNAWIAGDTGSNAYTIHGQSTGMVLVNCYGDSASEPLGSVAIDGGNSYTLDCGGTYAGYYTNTSLTPQTSDNNTAVLISRPTDSSFSTAWLLETTMPSTGAFNMSAEKAGTVIYTWNVTPLNRWVSPPFPSNFGGYSPPGFIPTFT
jgi:hypothetical protein